ncbi:hypothetical protein SIAM614_31596 [Stappia aggregata IAM 12614]|nr:hypothetical protein SIAM614_31596 [Stappia aggregata IAM 12614] [Roseibium aggregatum IAM 12614]
DGQLFVIYDQKSLALEKGAIIVEEE